MNPFDFVAAEDKMHALREIGQSEDFHPSNAATRFVAGGTNLLDLMKEHISRVGKLVDINSLPFNEITRMEDGGLRLGAMVRNADTAYNEEVRRRYPLLSQAILAGASPQIRNMASNGGNLLQRTRCFYFYDVGVPCNKRVPGSGCPAINGLHRQHAILGQSDACIATHPSDMCVALAALEATVQVCSARGERSIPFAEFHRLPGDRPDVDNTLAADELITHIDLPESDRFAAHSVYLKFRERASYAFALVSVAAALELDEQGHIREARIALGGVAHKPWRRLEAEQLLIGQQATTAVFNQVADQILAGAAGKNDNRFKIPMAHRAVVRALQVAVAGTEGIDPFVGEVS